MFLKNCSLFSHNEADDFFYCALVFQKQIFRLTTLQNNPLGYYDRRNDCTLVIFVNILVHFVLTEQPLDLFRNLFHFKSINDWIKKRMIQNHL